MKATSSPSLTEKTPNESTVLGGGIGGSTWVGKWGGFWLLAVKVVGLGWVYIMEIIGLQRKKVGKQGGFRLETGNWKDG